jgi:hypothetical protein
MLAETSNNLEVRARRYRCRKGHEISGWAVMDLTVHVDEIRWSKLLCPLCYAQWILENVSSVEELKAQMQALSKYVADSASHHDAIDEEGQ